MTNKWMKGCLMLAFLCVLPYMAVADREDDYYFYNPDGGQYIHENSRCSTISSKYWHILQPVSLEQLKGSEYRAKMLCSKCCTIKNYGDAFFQNRDKIVGCFNVIERAADNLNFYTSCYENALGYLIEEIGDREEQYTILVEEGQGRWGYPDDNDISREMAISIAYAALQEYIGIEDEELSLYFADPWLDVQSYGAHEWMVRINRVLHTYRFYNSSGYYVYINADDGLISQIRRY